VDGNWTLRVTLALMPAIWPDSGAPVKANRDRGRLDNKMPKRAEPTVRMCSDWSSLTLWMTALCHRGRLRPQRRPTHIQVARAFVGPLHEEPFPPIADLRVARATDRTTLAPRRAVSIHTVVSTSQGTFKSPANIRTKHAQQSVVAGSALMEQRPTLLLDKRNPFGRNFRLLRAARSGQDRHLVDISGNGFRQISVGLIAG
jgi:hypothetical protein